MKRIVAILVFVLISSYSFGQNNFPANGNVGIATGAITPGAKLSFNNTNDGSNGPDGITWYSPTPLAYGIHRTAGPWSAPNYQQLRLSWETGITLDPGTLYGKSYVDVQGSGLRVPSGNLGIGLTDPTEKLHIRAEGLLRPTFESVSNTDHYRALLDFKRSRGTVAAKLPVVLNDKLGSVYFWGFNGTSYIESSGINGVTEGTTTGSLKAGLSFATNDGTDLVNNSPVTRMYVTASGNVLINPKIVAGGHLDPAATSFNDGKLQVRGKIRAQEVKVEMANWSDFVFAKDYALPTLQETEKHIKEKGHLPGIPSAAEVEKNGIELGDMNKKLLQKIEELTLYLIEQKKQIETLNTKVENLQKNQKRY
jgi:hypothetical protein